jgi:hypothetical protein
MRKRSWFCLFALIVALALPLGRLASAPAPLPKPEKGLHSDAQVRVIAGYDPDRLQPGEEAPFLRVVPEGETRPLGTVLNALGFQASRLRDPCHRAFGKAIILTWRVSPSYELTCQLGEMNAEDLFDVRNEVYGVQIVKR